MLLCLQLGHNLPTADELSRVADVPQASDIRWASRWDTYLMMMDDQIHWFSIINSVMIVLFLSGMVAMIMMRTLHRDISKYNQLETAEEAQEETGWKLVRPASDLRQTYFLLQTGDMGGLQEGTDSQLVTCWPEKSCALCHSARTTCCCASKLQGVGDCH